ncbi:MAG: fibronectin type III domain-containing protein, partial [Oscillospiraceae bacterium]|nr:fibronectin type III domain-containing protein [Oscillospiraceae bacterium]
MVVAKEAYEITHWVACQDNGFTRSRRVVIPRETFYRMSALSGASGGPVGTEYCPLSDTSITGDGKYNSLADVGNAGDRNMIALLTRLFTWTANPNEDLMRRTDAVKPNGKPDNPLNMHPDLYVKAKLSPLDQALWGLLDEDPAEYREGSLPWYYEPALLPAGKGTGEDRILKVNGATYEAAYREFLQVADEMGFNDGMSLVIPTRDRVEAMLAGTDRDRDDMFGGIKMRGGVISVETIAINAVMAGCKPEHMPVLIAIAQALAMGWEEDGTQWHVMTTGSSGSALIALVSGPVVEEIGMEMTMGFAGAGNGVNNTLARAFRMFYSNIALNKVEWIDTQGYGNRPNDYLMMVVPENVAATRELGWKTHAEHMGFPNGSSSVTITQASTTNYLTANNADTNWSGTNMSTLNRITGQYNDNFQLAIYSPAHAWAIKNGIGASAARATKEEWAKTGTPVASSPVIYDPDNLGAGINADQNWPVVVGADNSATFSFNPGGALYKGGINNTVLLSGSRAVPGRGSPGAPNNVQVNLNTAARTATLTWDPPTYLGGGTIRGYEVFMLNGADLIKMDPIRVPGGAAARSYTFENLAPGEQYHFRVRAMNTVVNAIYTINRGVQTDWGGMGSHTGQHWLDFDRITGIGAWGRAKSAERSAIAGHAVYSHSMPGRVRVPEVTEALRNLIAHQAKESTDYLVRIPQNPPFSEHLAPNAKFIQIGADDPANSLRSRPGGDEQPFKLIFDEIENGSVTFPAQANGNVALTALSGGTLLRGSISQASLRTVHRGTTVNLVVTADSGYELVPGSLKINGVPATVGGTVAAASHSFVMPGADAKITAEFRHPLVTSMVIDSPAMLSISR